MTVDTSEALCVALADTWSFYFQAHSFHWNVEGPLFPQLHAFFGDIYEDAHDAVDGLAEQLRALGEKAPPSPSCMEAISGIHFSDDIPDAEGMVAALANDNEIVLGSLTKACAAASEAGEPGLSNYLQDRINTHKKWAWMLDASLTERASTADRLYGRRVVAYG